MFLDDLGIVADQPLAIDREAAESLASGIPDICSNGRPPRPHRRKRNLLGLCGLLLRRQMLGTHFPSRICFSQTDQAMPRGDAATVLLTKPVQELARDAPKFNIGAAIFIIVAAMGTSPRPRAKVEPNSRS